MAFWSKHLKRAGRSSRNISLVARRLTSEQLEQRLALSADSFGPCLLPEEAMIRPETNFESAATVSANETNRVTVFSGSSFADGNGVYAEVVDPDDTMIARLRVNSTVRGVQGSAAVDSNSEGEFVVAWSGRGVGDKSGIFFQRFDAEGMPMDSGTSAGETRVNTTVGGSQQAPAVVMADDGSFVIAWSGVGEGDHSGVFMRRFDENGEALGDEMLVNTITADRQQSPSLAFNTDGELIVAWQSLHQDGEDWGVYAQRYNLMGVAEGDETQLSNTTDGSQTAPKLATDPTGGIVAAWQSRNSSGDGWDVIARHFENDLTPSDPEVMLNSSTEGDQQNVAIGVAEDGQWLAAWSTGVHDGAGWEVATRSFSGDGSAAAEEEIDEESGGVNSGHQHSPNVSIVGGLAQVVWAGTSRSGSGEGYSQNYDLVLVDNGPPSAPELAEIANREGVVGTEVEIIVTASDANPLDNLTFELVTDEVPEGATIEQTGDDTAIIRWTPGEDDYGADVSFRVRVTDSGEMPLSDTEDFEIEVANRDLSLDLNGTAESGKDSIAEYVVGSGFGTIADENLSILEADDEIILGASAQLVATPDGTAELLSVDTSGTSITAEYDFATRTLTLSGSDSAANYQQVLRTLAYNNQVGSINGNRSVLVSVTDENESTTQTISVVALAPDLVEFAKAIADSGARFFGAGWCPHCTDQKELFEDGADHLPFMEVTNPDRTLNQLGMDNNISVYPTWVFADGSRLEGVQSLETLSARTGVEIPSSKDPYFAEIEDTTLLVGSPLHVSLDGHDPNGGELTYTVQSDNPDVTATILSGNRSARISVEGYGDMVFELFEQRAERATSRLIELAEDDFHAGVIFHRVLDDFVIQGGDPTGTGSGGSELDDFDDQFHVDLQHNRTGLLSMAKTSDDTNDSQFFITEGPSRHLDFNHTIFGVMVEGESNRDAISETAVDSPNSGRPDNDVVMEGIEIFDDIENGVLMLKAAEGATGSANITVTVTDEDGNTFDRTFTVELEDDTVNGRPFLGDVAPMSFPRNLPAEIQLTSTDVEGDDVFYFAAQTGDVEYTVEASETGLVTVTPPTDFVGEVEVLVAVGPSANSSLANLDVQTILVEFT